MTLEATYTYLLDKPGAAEGFPFGPEVCVFKVGGKMFALLAPDTLPPRVSLKCDPDRAIQLRTAHEAIEGAYHMNKTHWNQVALDGSVPSALVRDLIDHSYDLIVASLTRKQRALLSQAPE